MQIKLEINQETNFSVEFDNRVGQFWWQVANIVYAINYVLYLRLIYRIYPVYGTLVVNVCEVCVEVVL